MILSHFFMSEHSMTYIADWTQAHGYDLGIDQLHELYYHLQIFAISNSSMCVDESKVFEIINTLFGESVPVLSSTRRT